MPTHTGGGLVAERAHPDLARQLPRSRHSIECAPVVLALAEPRAGAHIDVGAALLVVKLSHPFGRFGAYLV
jgi:hypothetical protein